MPPTRRAVATSPLLDLSFQTPDKTTRGITATLLSCLPPPSKAPPCHLIWQSYTKSNTVIRLLYHPAHFPLTATLPVAASARFHAQRSSPPLPAPTSSTGIHTVTHEYLPFSFCDKLGPVHLRDNQVVAFHLTNPFRTTSASDDEQLRTSERLQIVVNFMMVMYAPLCLRVVKSRGV
uniref:Uncharacterized protein n=1 Tax=Psilocybe cubensis TaxID=181762 RepID=A0A8H7XZM6_PSICU